jgi:hypothetical protein
VPPWIWPLQRDPVHDPADVLDRGQLHDLDQTELHVDVHHRPVHAQRQLDVGVALAGGRVQRRRGPVPEHRRLLDHGVAQQRGEIGHDRAVDEDLAAG